MLSAAEAAGTQIDRGVAREEGKVHGAGALVEVFGKAPRGLCETENCQGRDDDAAGLGPDREAIAGQACRVRSRGKAECYRGRPFGGFRDGRRSATPSEGIGDRGGGGGSFGRSGDLGSVRRERHGVRLNVDHQALVGEFDEIAHTRQLAGRQHVQALAPPPAVGDLLAKLEDDRVTDAMDCGRMLDDGLEVLEPVVRRAVLQVRQRLGVAGEREGVLGGMVSPGRDALPRALVSPDLHQAAGVDPVGQRHLKAVAVLHEVEFGHRRRGRRRNEAHGWMERSALRAIGTGQREVARGHGASKHGDAAEREAAEEAGGGVNRYGDASVRCDEGAGLPPQSRGR